MKKALKIVGTIILIIIVLNILGGKERENSTTTSNTNSETSTGTEGETTKTGDAGDNVGPSPVWVNEEAITITGYDDDAMEVAISPDGKYLLYNQDGEFRDLYWAERVTDTEYKHMGVVENTQTDTIDGTPSFSNGNTLYYFSLENAFTDRRTIYKGNFVNGVLENKTVVDGDLYKQDYIKTDGIWLSLDPEVSTDNNRIVYSQGFFQTGKLPDPFTVNGVEKIGEVYKKMDDSIFASVNDGTLNYAPTMTDDGLELYWSKIKNGFFPSFEGVYVAVRASTNEPFGKPEKVTAITGHVEAPSLSGDEQYLYYHRKDKDKVWRIYRVKRAN